MHHCTVGDGYAAIKFCDTNLGFGTCKDCPQLTLDVALGVDLERTISFTQWKKGPSGKAAVQGEINSLFQVTTSRSEAIDRLKVQAGALKKHIFIAYNQWRAKKLAEANLDTKTLLMVEDYQQNFTVF